MNSATTAPPERGLPTDRRIAAVELLLSQGWAWHDGAWTPPARQLEGMAHVGWIQCSQTSTVDHLASTIDVTLIDSTQIRMVQARPLQLQPNNRLFPLYSPAVRRDGATDEAGVPNA